MILRLVFIIILIAGISSIAPGDVSSVDAVKKRQRCGPLSGGVVQYYSGGWQDIGSTSGGQVSKELLSGTYTFSMNYAYAHQEKAQNIAADPTVVFNTGGVHSDSGSCTQYYAGRWRTFTQDIKLLPLAYTFRFNDTTPETPYTIISGTVNHIH